MPKPRPQHFNVAKQLLAHQGSGTSDEPALAAEVVYETLFQALAPIIGAAGVRALVARSVRLSVAEFPCLRALVATTEPGEDQGQRLVACLSPLAAASALAVATGLYATLLGLMSNFIGERMVGQLVGKAFPGTEITELKEKSDEQQRSHSDA